MSIPFFFFFLIVVYSFVEMAKYLLSLKSGAFLLSERFNQDSPESYFGQQCARCGRSDNPSAKTFLYTEQAIRVQRSVAVSHVGNVRKSALTWNEDELSRPLKKRPRKSLSFNN